MFALLKGKLTLIWGGITVFLIAALKYFKDKSKREKEKRLIAERAADYLKDVAELDNEIDSQTESRRVEARKSLERGEIPEHLR